MNTTLCLPRRNYSLDSKQTAVKTQKRAVVMLFYAAQIYQYDRGKNVFSNNFSAQNFLTSHKSAMVSSTNPINTHWQPYYYW